MKVAPLARCTFAKPSSTRVISELASGGAPSSHCAERPQQSGSWWHQWPRQLGSSRAAGGISGHAHQKARASSGGLWRATVVRGEPPARAWPRRRR